MKVLKIFNDLLAFVWDKDNHNHANTYLLKGDRNILIDAGFLVPYPVYEVVFTHCHVDHTFYCKEYKKRGAKLMISEEDFIHLERNDNIRQSPLARKFYGEAGKCKADIKLREGDVIKNSNWNLKVISAPGHTPGSIILFDERRKVAFVGDLVIGNKMGHWNHPGGDPIEIRKSYLKLKRLNPSYIFAGHSILLYGI